jgi:uncharacterized RDD family membrane protein YckC
MRGFPGSSAAQNGPVIRICSKCGALLLDDAESCSFCEVEAAQDARRGKIPEPVAVASGNAAEVPEPEWRVEVSRRLEQYRARRGYVRTDEPQSGLPFRHASAVADADDVELEMREPPRPPRPSSRARGSERLDICIQPELNFSSSPEERARPQTALVPVAPLGERRWAGFLDALFLALTCTGFAGLFHSLGGRFTLGKTDVIVYLAVAYIFFGVYFSLFTVLAGATPGMQLLGLTVVRLDGSLPDTHQLLWRTFGYLLSGATLMLGFIWAIWDDDRFTWHDRMSQTYITAAAPLVELEAVEVRAANRRYARR